LRLNDERVSRFHAKVQQEDGDIIITDLESTNGTRVNGSPIQIRRLRPGDQISIGRSMLLFGTLEEIAARKAAEREAARAADVPGGQTVAGSIPGDNHDFIFPHSATGNFGTDATFGNSEKEMPPLPQKFSTAQAARLAEIFDFLHRGLTSALENIEASEDGTLIRIGFGEWQTIQAVQLFLARYMRAVADPDQQPD
jgi:hypothetical protein